MNQLTEIALCILVFVCRVCSEDNENSVHVRTRDGSFGDATTRDDISNDNSDTKSEEIGPDSNKFNISNPPSWLNESINDIAYNLRMHKFNEYDRRYVKPENAIIGRFVGNFPVPTLRSFHWEVRKHCEVSFLDCVTFLKERIKDTDLRRKDDTVTVIKEQNWNGSEYAQKIADVDKECQGMKKKDEDANPFQGPLERFQWRTTASYYMCWYTMNGVSALERFNDSCDNIAQCLDPGNGTRGDLRAIDGGFQCALYSFCPDPCCPFRHLSNMSACWESTLNPCYADGPVGNWSCSLERDRNVHLSDIALNRWNVTCECKTPGYKWTSRYGICVDINECSTGQHDCHQTREVCLNLPGSYYCTCNWGYKRDPIISRCEPTFALKVILHGFPEIIKEKPHSGSLLGMIKETFQSEGSTFSSTRVIFVTVLVAIL